MELSFCERRVLGVLMEKSYATPEQYPLTLTALIAGANQRSCRDPVSSLDEDHVLDALDSLRQKELVSLVRTAGGRTDRWRHRAADTLELEGRPAAVVAELLLRGPQTDGELRQRASRLVPIPDLAELGRVIDDLAHREPPLVRRISGEARRRGARYAHCLYPADEAPAAEPEPSPAGRPATAFPSPAPSAPATPPPAAGPTAEDLVELRAEVAELRERVARLEDELSRLRGA